MSMAGPRIASLTEPVAVREWASSASRWRTLQNETCGYVQSERCGCGCAERNMWARMCSHHDEAAHGCVQQVPSRLFHDDR
eukprot:2648823-Rhodomonas_salina.3